MLAAALPQVEEKLSHGSPCWRVADKRMFAYFWHNHHGDGITAVLVKTSGTEEQQMLIEMDPDVYFKPPISAPPAGWACGSISPGPTGTASNIACAKAGASRPRRSWRR